MKVTSKSAALVVVALAAAQTANAATVETTSPTRVAVQFTDLNLNSQAGLEVLYQRLSAASRQVCGDTSELKRVGSLKQLRVNKECYESTMAQALAEVNFPSLAQARN